MGKFKMICQAIVTCYECLGFSGDLLKDYRKFIINVLKKVILSMLIVYVST
jgi:hypothetical protein